MIDLNSEHHIVGEWQFRKDYKPYLVERLKFQYFAYDYFKFLLHNCIDKKNYDIGRLDSSIYKDIRRVNLIISELAVDIYDDLQYLRSEIVAHLDKNIHAQKNVLNYNIISSMRSLYERTVDLKKFYDLNFFCIIKISKKFDKLITSMAEAACRHSNPKSMSHYITNPMVALKNVGKTMSQSAAIAWHSGNLLALRRGTFDENDPYTPWHLTQDTSWKDLPGGSYFYTEFCNQAAVIDLLLKDIVDAYSTGFRRCYSEISEHELKYTKTEDIVDDFSKFSMGMKFGLIFCMVSNVLIIFNIIQISLTSPLVAFLLDNVASIAIFVFQLPVRFLEPARIICLWNDWKSSSLSSFLVVQYIHLVQIWY
jgi:hypothetical protein